MKKEKLFIWGDAGADTGFARVTHSLIMHLHDYYDIFVLALNYSGDPHPIQEFARLYNPRAKDLNDFYGYSRLYPLIKEIKPDVVLFINDPWIAAQALESMPDLENKPFKFFLYTPVDTNVLKPTYVLPLVAFDHVITYTQFGKSILMKYGLSAESISIIPHGVDETLFYPIDREILYKHSNIQPDWFIVQMVAQNQLRKRVDLGLYYFSQWVKNKPDNVKFFYHGPLATTYGWDIPGLIQEFGISDRFISLGNNDALQGISTENMKFIYNAADIHMSTSMAEGWNLPVMESMACSVANLVPNHTAFSEWPKGGVHYIDTTNEPFYTVGTLNTEQYVPSFNSTLDGLERLYTDESYRKRIGKAGYDIVRQYKWNNIAESFHNTFLNNGV